MKKINFLFTIVLLVSLIGCTSQKKIAYFHDIETLPADSIRSMFSDAHETKICVGDMLSIVVSGIDPKVIAPFNLPVVGYENPGSDQLYSSPTIQSYLVDVDGAINFPVVGKIELAGLTKSQAIARINDRLSPFLKDAIVTIKFLNYNVTIIGEVAKPGKYVINNERVTILDALALAGDMTVYGKRNNVLVIRENSGEVARLNLNSTEIFTSPYYYLQQNDVLYVEPNNVKAISGLNLNLYLSTITTLASLLSVIFTVTRK
ncbi:polysaccharide export protein [Paludibacter sp. 221]|uniref:polysaccharide biosynthesis/export family protein n=1 Tax=Paludibacter sp. 221 TaxID=2302939 RepID=UPI0013D68211|nr:polysaccharide biosynthesis/export family protein [Paludibacter sp. 221]NDV46425.1 polysaccharide export protein [Paludibacter sp. 221]